METNPLSEFFDAVLAPAQRRSIRLHEPGTQLRLPAYLLGVSLGFSGLFALNVWAAYSSVYDMTLSLAPTSFEGVIQSQTGDFLAVTAIIAVAYAVVVLAVTAGYLHKVIGPTIALKRHVQSLKKGEYGSRIVLRDGHPVYLDLASNLNDLAERLQRADFERRQALGLGPAEVQAAPLQRGPSRRVEGELALAAPDPLAPREPQPLDGPFDHGHPDPLGRPEPLSPPADPLASTDPEWGPMTH